MKVSLPLLLISLLFVSCGQQARETASETFDQVYVMPGADTDTGPLPELANTFGVNISLVNFSVTEEEKIDQAIEIIKLVVATEQFRSLVLNYTYNGTKAFIDNNGYTNSQIYQMILDGAETLKRTKNNIMDGEVELYYENSTTVGYTYKTTNRIWVNRKYFNNYTAAGVAHNLFHEWMHKLGFNHATSWDVSRDSSVPYAVGYLVGEIGKDFL
jgi:hypothetical protein